MTKSSQKGVLLFQNEGQSHTHFEIEIIYISNRKIHFDISNRNTRLIYTFVEVLYYTIKKPAFFEIELCDDPNIPACVKIKIPSVKWVWVFGFFKSVTGRNYQKG
jgi:hypothetical protein